VRLFTPSTNSSWILSTHIGGWWSSQGNKFDNDRSTHWDAHIATVFHNTGCRTHAAQRLTMHKHVNGSNYLTVPMLVNTAAGKRVCLCLPYDMSAVSREDPPEHYNAGRADAALIYIYIYLYIYRG